MKRFRLVGGPGSLVVAGLVAAYAGFGMAVHRVQTKTHPRASIVCIGADEILRLRAEGWGIAGRGLSTKGDTALLLTREGKPGAQFVLVDGGGFACPVSLKRWSPTPWQLLPDL